MAADDVEIDAKLPRVGDAVFAAELEAEVRNAGQMIAGKDVDGSGDGVGKGVERRRQRQGILEGGVDRVKFAQTFQRSHLYDACASIRWRNVLPPF